MFIYVYYANEATTNLLYDKANLLKNIEYTSIYPHKIVYGPYVTLYGIGRCTGNTIAVDSLQDFDRCLAAVLDEASGRFLGIQLNESITFTIALRFIENLANSLKRSNVKTNSVFKN